MVKTGTDQAEGLRRLRAAPMPSVCTVLSAEGHLQKPALMQRLAHSMARRGRTVILLHAGPVFEHHSSGKIEKLVYKRYTLTDVAAGRITLNDAVTLDESGIRQVAMGDLRDVPAMNALIRALAQQPIHWLINAELDAAGQLPLPVLTEGELVLQLSANPVSIRKAYDMMRALKDLCMPGALSLLVTDASPAHARQVRANLFQAASRYLAMPVRTIVPPSGVHHA